tara:strand:- start:189 stop:422 length:234 start_codon:yes stop_codon:yes gene_type:complete
MPLGVFPLIEQKAFHLINLFCNLGTLKFTSIIVRLLDKELLEIDQWQDTEQMIITYLKCNPMKFLVQRVEDNFKDIL